MFLFFAWRVVIDIIRLILLIGKPCNISDSSTTSVKKSNYILEIHACSNPSPLTKSMQLYFRNYMKYSIGFCHSNTAIVILSVYFFKMTKYQFLILVLLTIFLNGTPFVIT